MVFIKEPVFLLRVSRLTEDFFDFLWIKSIDGVEDTFEFVDCLDEDEDKLLDEQLSLSLDWDAEKPYWNLVFNSTWETFEAWIFRLPERLGLLPMSSLEVGWLVTEDASEGFDELSESEVLVKLPEDGSSIASPLEEEDE